MIGERCDQDSTNIQRQHETLGGSRCPSGSRPDARSRDQQEEPRPRIHVVVRISLLSFGNSPTCHRAFLSPKPVLSCRSNKRDCVCALVVWDRCTAMPLFCYFVSSLVCLFSFVLHSCHAIVWKLFRSTRWNFPEHVLAFCYIENGTCLCMLISSVALTNYAVSAIAQKKKI